MVWTPRYRGKVMVSKYIKDEFERIFKTISKWKHFVVHECYVADDHIHLFITIPPKHSVSYALSILKGKSSSWIKKKTKKIPKGSFWCRGYFVATVGINEIAIRRYIKNQDKYQISQDSLFS